MDMRNKKVKPFGFFWLLNILINKEGLKRIFAFIVDYFIAKLIILTIYNSIYIFIYKIFPDMFYIFENNNINLIITIVDYSLVLFFYFFLQELYTQQTIGKRLFKLKVLNLKLKKPNIKQIFIRTIFRVIDNFLIIGSLQVIFFNKNQRWGDIVAGTCVLGVEDDRIILESD